MNPAVEINQFLRDQDSPLAGKGAVFVREGRRNGIDPKLLVAITGAESDFGKYGPIQPIHNPFGWGPHIKFKSWDDAISTVARGLRRGYLDEGLKTISQIGAKWAPSGAANDPTNLNSNWAKNVGKFYTQLGGQGVTPTNPLAPSPLGAAPPAPLPTNGADLAGLALSNLSALTAAGKRPSPEDMLSGLTQAVAAAPPPAPTAPVTPSTPAAPTVPQGTAKGFQPAFATALDRMIAASGGRVQVVSGYRSPERQAELFAAAVKKYGSKAAARKWVAPPGKSRHGAGDAADLGGDLAWVKANAARFGLYQPMSWEPWHWELRGSRG